MNPKYDFDEVALFFPKAEHMQMASLVATDPLMWCEVLDVTKKIFVIGFK